jgi:hypothetical protein
VAFHLPPEVDAPAMPSLCFEERYGRAGLHRFHDASLDRLIRGKRLTLRIRLGPEQIEALQHPNALRRDFRALYRLPQGDERPLFLLEEVEEYDTETETAKCKLLKL